MAVLNRGHRAFKVYYARGWEMLRDERMRRGAGERVNLAFVTGGALFCIKLIGRDAKHIVALDANAMEYRALW